MTQRQPCWNREWLLHSPAGFRILMTSAWTRKSQLSEKSQSQSNELSAGRNKLILRSGARVHPSGREGALMFQCRVDPGMEMADMIHRDCAWEVCQRKVITYKAGFVRPETETWAPRQERAPFGSRREVAVDRHYCGDVTIHVA